jgi:hypothetical protein
LRLLIDREILIKADSYLSLLWYRPSTPHDTELQLEVPRVIAALRAAYEHPAPLAPSMTVTRTPLAPELKDTIQQNIAAGRQAAPAVDPVAETGQEGPTRDE